MIRDIEIRNFKCFPHLKVEGCKRINLIVGDNGAGKTAFLEAVFDALAGNASVVIRHRQARGFDGQFLGTSKVIEDALWGDLFYNFESKNPVSIILSGTGRENRSLFISRESQGTLVPLDDIKAPASSSQFNFIWRNSEGREYNGAPTFSGPNIQFPPDREDLPDYFFVPSTMVGASGENAARFSELSKARKQRLFVELFIKEYPWIEDLSIEITAGQPVIHATLKGMQEKLPLNSISSGINRIVSILLIMASHPRAVLLVDEIENGLYYKHQRSFWRWILSFSKQSETQLFLTTHSREWLESLVSVGGDDLAKEIAFWRLERDESGVPEMMQFSGKSLRAAIEQGEEVRGGSE